MTARASVAISTTAATAMLELAAVIAPIRLAAVDAGRMTDETRKGFTDGEIGAVGRPSGDDEGGVEIAYFGLLPEFIGRGLGGALLTSAIDEAWRTSSSVSRVWVHTCTLDHPGALGNYQARGMVIYKEETTES